MKLEVVGISAGDEKRAWALFPKSPMQATLHNEVVRKIESLRDELETSTRETFLETQLSLKAHRYLLGLIHRNDQLLTK